jgi:hypothetical protein
MENAEPQAVFPASEPSDKKRNANDRNSPGRQVKPHSFDTIPPKATNGASLDPRGQQMVKG